MTKKIRKNLKAKIDDKDDLELVSEYQRRPSKFKPISKNEEKALVEAARTFIAEDESKRITIRLPGETLVELKNMAMREGLPYQTMIQSLLHKIVTEQLIPRVLLEDRDKKIEKLEKELRQRRA